MMLGLGEAQFKTDAEIIGCLLAGGTRDTCGMPAYCYAPTTMSEKLDFRRWYRGVLPQCQPITMEEQYEAAKAEGELACERDEDPQACYLRHMARAEESAKIALPKGDADEGASGECEYRALEEHPTLARILSPEVLCKLQQGEYTVYLVAGGAALLWLLTRGK